MKYIVALVTGGLMESPERFYENFQVIDADDAIQAKKIYDKNNKCSYFYGLTVCKYDQNTEWLIGHKPIACDVIDRLFKVNQ